MIIITMMTMVVVSSGGVASTYNLINKNIKFLMQ